MIGCKWLGGSRLIRFDIIQKQNKLINVEKIMPIGKEQALQLMRPIDWLTEIYNERSQRVETVQVGTFLTVTLVDRGSLLVVRGVARLKKRYRRIVVTSTNSIGW